MPTNPAIRTEPFPVVLYDVSHVYSGRPVLRHLDGTFERGRCSLLLGPNGSGKSTLLRILAGLLRPSFGRVLAWGGAPGGVRERIGYMSHAPMLYEELSGTENLHYFAELYAPRDCMTASEALRAVDLDPALTEPVRAYSQGMRQRVSLARVLLSRPALLLLDEPFSNLDIASSQAMLRLLARERDRGCTIILTTHQRELAEPIADEVLLLAQGALQTEPPTEDAHA